MREFGYYWIKIDGGNYEPALWLPLGSTWWIIGKNTWFQDNERITGASDRIIPPDDNETIR